MVYTTLVPKYNHTKYQVLIIDVHILYIPGICIYTYMESWSLVGKGTSHSEGRRRGVEVGTRLGAGVAAEGVVAELVSKLRSLVDRRHSRRG